METVDREKLIAEALAREERLKRWKSSAAAEKAARAVDAAIALERLSRLNEACGSKLRGEIMHNQRIKIYPQGYAEVLTASRPIFREPGYELRDKPAKARSPQPEPKAVSEPDPDRQRDNIERAVRRAKQNLRDLALCNDMRYFVTLTLDKEVVDRYDMREITRRLNSWCSNMVQRRGLAYVLVPERHKDGAVHFHGFVNAAVTVEDSGTISLPGEKKPRRPASEDQRREWIAAGGHVVYNLPEWPLGFTTAIELYGDPVRAVGYCCKYIGKQQPGSDLPEKIGGRWFYHGGCRSGPEIVYRDVDFDNMEMTDNAFAWEVMAAGATFVKETFNY
jgi:hypothetical protein